MSEFVWIQGAKAQTMLHIFKPSRRYGRANLPYPEDGEKASSCIVGALDGALEPRRVLMDAAKLARALKAEYVRYRSSGPLERDMLCPLFEHLLASSCLFSRHFDPVHELTP